MKHKVLRIIGVLLLVLGAALIILQLMAREKSVFKSIAGGATPISMGSILLGASRRLDKKKRLQAIDPKPPNDERI